VHEATLGVMQRLDIQDLLRELLEDAVALFDTQHGYIYLRPPGEDEIRSTAALGVFEVELGHRIGLGEGLVGRVWQAAQPIVVDDYDEWEGRDPAFPRGRVRALAGFRCSPERTSSEAWLTMRPTTGPSARLRWSVSSASPRSRRLRWTTRSSTRPPSKRGRPPMAPTQPRARSWPP
jgi:GAF domain